MILAAVVPVVLVGVMHWLVPALMPPTIPFGVRVTRDHADAPVITEWRRRYRLVTAAVTVVAAAGALLIGHVWAGPAALGVELLAGVLLYLAARARIAAVKADEGWFEGRRQVTVADTSLRTDPERYPWLWSLPAILLTAATVVTGIAKYPSMPSRLAIHFGASGRADHYAAKSLGSAFGPLLAQVASTVLLLALAGVALRSRAQLDAEDPQAATRHRRFVTTIARGLLVLAACTSVTFLFGSLATWRVFHSPGPLLSALTVVPGLLGAAVLLVMAVRVGQGGSRVRLAGVAGDGRTVNRDDDSLYRWGLFYFNRDDPSVFVPKRFGVGWTVNFARPVTWLVLGAVVVVAVIGGTVR